MNCKVDFFESRLSSASSSPVSVMGNPEWNWGRLITDHFELGELAPDFTHKLQFVDFLETHKA